MITPETLSLWMGHKVPFGHTPTFAARRRMMLARLRLHLMGIETRIVTETDPDGTVCRLEPATLADRERARRLGVAP